MTPAGKKLLERYVRCERLGMLQGLVNGAGEEMGCGMALRPGDGGELASAQKLARDGFARLVGGRRNASRYLIITASGRDAL